MCNCIVANPWQEIDVYRIENLQIFASSSKNVPKIFKNRTKYRAEVFQCVEAS